MYDSAVGGAVGQVLGATAVAGGVAMLPDTGVNWVHYLLPVLAISLGSLVIASSVITRLITRFSK